MVLKSSLLLQVLIKLKLDLELEQVCIVILNNRIIRLLQGSQLSKQLLMRLVDNELLKDVKRQNIVNKLISPMVITT